MCDRLCDEAGPENLLIATRAVSEDGQMPEVGDKTIFAYQRLFDRVEQLLIDLLGLAAFVAN